MSQYLEAAVARSEVPSADLTHPNERTKTTEELGFARRAEIRHNHSWREVFLNNIQIRPVDVNDSLPVDVRRVVDIAFDHAVREIGEEEFYYIGRTFDRKTRAVEGSRIPWVRDLVQQLRNLHHLYHRHSLGELHLSDHALAVIGATLFYFVNPYDIIPDHIPGRGYLDDAYVYNRCVAALKKLAPEYLD